MRTAIYTRISQDDAAKPNGRKRKKAWAEEGQGVATQEQDLRELAARLGWEVIDVYSDNDKSAYSGKVRPGYRHLLDDIKAGRIQAIVAKEPDRLYARPDDLAEFVRVVEAAGCKIETLKAGRIDLTTANGRMVARILGDVSMHEREHMAERIKRKMTELAENGKDHGGPRPRGYQSDRRTIEPVEADAIREAARRLLAGDSIRHICSDLTAATGMTWQPAGLRRILRSARISGRSEHRGRIVAESTSWEPIISIEDSDKLRALLSDPERRTPGRPGEYLLTGGTAVCGACGVSLVSHPHAGRRRMECRGGPGFRGCGKVGIAAEQAEELVSEAVLRRVDDGALKALLRAEADPSLLGGLAKTERKLAELAVMWAEDQLTRGEFEAARAVHLAKQKDLSRRLEASRRQSGLEDLPDPLRAKWPTLGLPRKKAVVRALVEAVVIAPATRRGAGFDPERITIVWRA